MTTCSCIDEGYFQAFGQNHSSHTTGGLGSGRCPCPGAGHLGKLCGQFPRGPTTLQYDAEPAAQFAQARALYRQRRFAEAAGLAASLARTHPGQSHFAAFAAEACQASGDLSGALEWIDQAIAGADDPQHLVKKAWLLSQALRR